VYHQPRIAVRQSKDARAANVCVRSVQRQAFLLNHNLAVRVRERHRMARRSKAVGSEGLGQLGTPSVELRTTMCIARPPRVAIGMPDRVTAAQWCNLLQRVASRWGGLDSTMYFPADAWAPGSLWDGLLERFDPDSIMFYREPQNMEEFKERYDPLECWVYKWLFHVDKGALPIDWATPIHVAARAWAARLGAYPLTAIQTGAVEGGRSAFTFCSHGNLAG
jgi:hypothetical protein